MGFNMIRKHIKVEPDRWYYHCDKLGILVWQDMPSAMAVLPKDMDKKPIHLQHVYQKDTEELNKNSEDANQFESELKTMIATHYNYPSIVMWVPHNEGMGQYATVRITNMVKSMDQTRLVDPASGWAIYPCGDIYDIHTYEESVVVPPACVDRASAVGEFGGLGYPIKDHLWNPQMRNWGYQTYQTAEDLLKNYKNRFDQIVEMKKVKGSVRSCLYTNHRCGR